MATQKKGWDRFGKTTNLTEKQKATGSRAGGGKISKAERYMATKGGGVNISNTEWKQGVGLVNKSDQSTKITGRVKLPSGEVANYVRGKRIVASKPRSIGSTGSGGSTSRTQRSKTTPAPKTDSRNAPGSNVSRGTAGGPGLRGTASVRGKYGTGSGYKPNTVAPKKLGGAGSKASDRAIANLLTGAATYGKDYYKQSSADRLTPKKPGAAAPKRSTRPKVQMPSNDAVKKATGGVYGMTAAGTPFRKAMPKGGQTDFIRGVAPLALMPGVGVAAGAIKGSKTVGQIVAKKVLGSKAGQAAGRGTVSAVKSGAAKAAGSKAGQAAGRTGAGKKVANKVATSRANANAAKTQRWIDAENSAAKTASKADARARARAAANRAANAPTAAGRKTGLSNIRRNAEVPKYGRTKVGTAKTPKASVKRTFVNGVSQPVKKAAAKKTTPRKK